MEDVELRQWVQRYHAGETGPALDAIYNGTFDPVYRYIFKHVGNRTAAEDITSDTFLTFIEKIDNYNGNSKVVTYIIGIAFNKIRQYWQKNPNMVDIDDLAIAQPPDDSQSYSTNTPAHTHVDEENINKDSRFDNEDPPDMSQRLAPHLKTVMEKLKENYRTILHLRFYECLSIRETAERMGITEQNVRTTQHRALKRAAALAEKLDL